MTKAQLQPLAAFLRARTIKAPGLTTRTRDLHHAFIQQLSTGQRSGWPRATFGEGLGALGIDQGVSGGQIRCADLHLITAHCVVADGKLARVPV